jgi:hypothetical protein
MITTMSMERISRNLIAPCGMDCGLCVAHLRERNRCCGCMVDGNKVNHCVFCKIKNCKERKGRYCDCANFPCVRLKNLDKRYRTKYGMSEIKNLMFIKSNGINKFVKKERKSHQAIKGILCVHDKKYY